jgi:NodT family efflux transporter outer membrane factor (OMF) lipoprotein
MTFRTPPFCLPLVASLLLAACAAPHVTQPTAVVAAPQFKETDFWQRAALADTLPVSDAWWTLFKDPVLDDLEARLVIGNENLKVSMAQVTIARAALDASRSALFPTLSAGLSGTRSENTAGANAVKTASPRNALTASANTSWEVDVWGRLSEASRGAQETLQASANDLAAIRLSAQATLAQTYFSLRTAEAQRLVLTDNVAAYQRSLSLTEARYSGGVAALTDVLLAQTQLKSAQALVAESIALRAQLEHAIAVLLGLPPSALGLERSAKVPASPAVPTLLPATLLERRPDIAAAQRRVVAAYAQIGVTDAAFYPALILSGSAGYTNTSLSNLVSAPNLLWSVGTSMTQAIFDGGQRKFASAQARALAEQSSASYRQTVLVALQEVEDNLVLADQLARESQVQREALQAAKMNLDITLEQYRAGTVSYLNVVSAQTAALTIENSLLIVQNRQLAAVNQILKNIAGRWEPAR